MKRSEGRKKLVAKGWQGNHAELCLSGLDELGVVTWDPEGPEMAERLHAVDVCGVPGFQGDQWVLAVCRDFVRVRLATKDEATLAADLYNRRGAIEEVARELRRLGGYSPIALNAEYVGKLADRLEGKE